MHLSKLQSEIKLGCLVTEVQRPLDWLDKRKGQSAEMQPSADRSSSSTALLTMTGTAPTVLSQLLRTWKVQSLGRGGLLNISSQYHPGSEGVFVAYLGSGDTTTSGSESKPECQYAHCLHVICPHVGLTDLVDLPLMVWDGGAIG